MVAPDYVGGGRGGPETRSEPTRTGPLAAPEAGRVEWLAAYWVSDQRIRRIRTQLASRRGGWDMYGWFVERKVRSVFEALSRKDVDDVVTGLAPHVHHRFAGDHPLGGERHDREAVRLWFGRLYRLFPELQFSVTSVSVSGPPWNMTVGVEWVAEVSPAAGPAYTNVGAHVLRIRGGKVACLHAYEDSQAVAEACRVMHDAGIPEASAAPITRASSVR